MKKLLLGLFVISLLLLIFSKKKTEKIVRTESDRVVFESGNYARTYDYDATPEIHNPTRQRTYKKFSVDDKLIEQGLFINGEFSPDNDRVENSRYFLYALMTLILAVYSIFFFRSDYVLVRDWYTNRTNIPHTAMNREQLKAALSGKMSCDKCNADPDFLVQKETLVQGMIFLEGKCNICLEDKKIRVK